MPSFTQTPSTIHTAHSNISCLSSELWVFSHSSCFEDRNNLVFLCQMLPFVQNTKTADVLVKSSSLLRNIASFTIFLALSPTFSISPLLTFCSKREVMQKQSLLLSLFPSIHLWKTCIRTLRTYSFSYHPSHLSLQISLSSLFLFLKHLPSDKASQKWEINFERL